MLVIDMLNAYSHGDAEPLATNVAKIISPLSALIGVARDHDGIDLIYAHDNYGDFTGDTADIVQAALDGHRPELMKSIVPQKDSMVLSKARHSAFYASPLAYLLRRLETKTLILTGQVTEQCILCTALDGYIRPLRCCSPDRCGRPHRCRTRRGGVENVAHQHARRPSHDR